MNNSIRKPNIMVDFLKHQTGLQARAYTDLDNLDAPPIASDVIGTAEETLGNLAMRFPQFRFSVVCPKCGNSENREFAFDWEKGLCEWCLMSEAEQKGLQADWRRNEEYVFGPPDDPNS